MLFLFAPDAPSALPYQLSSEHRTSLRLKCCLVLSSTPRAPPPRSSICPFIHCRGAYALHCIPGYQLLVQYQVTRFHCTPLQLVTDFPTNHVSSRMLPGAPRMNRVSAETPREGFGSISVCYMLRAKVPTERTGTLGTSQVSNQQDTKESKRSADACLSLARIALKLCVAVR